MFNKSIICSILILCITALTVHAEITYRVKRSETFITKQELLDICFQKTKQMLRQEGRTFVGTKGQVNVMEYMLPILDATQKPCRREWRIIGNYTWNKQLLPLEIKIVEIEGEEDIQPKEFVPQSENARPWFTEGDGVTAGKITLGDIDVIPSLSYDTYAVLLQDVNTPLTIKYEIASVVITNVNAPASLTYQVYEIILHDPNAPANMVYEVYELILHNTDVPSNLVYEVYSAVVGNPNAPSNLVYEVYSAVVGDPNAPSNLVYEVYDLAINDPSTPSNLVYKVQYKILEGIIPQEQLSITSPSDLSDILKYSWSSLYSMSKFSSNPKERIKTNNIDGWLKAEINTSEEDIQYVKIPNQLKNTRFVAEIRTPVGNEEKRNQIDEIKYFRKMGYNGILMVWVGEDPTQLSEIARLYQSSGMKVGFVYAIDEGSKGSIFKDYAFMKAAFQKIIPNCDFVLLSWRGSTETHWENKDMYKIFLKIVANTARSVSPNISILDSVFIKDNRVVDGFVLNNVSGRVVYNIGSVFYQNVSILNMNNLTDGIPLVFGATPYWNSKLSIDKSVYTVSQLRRLCKEVENDILKNGNPFTITMAGNGLGDRFGNSDSLTKTKWRKNKIGDIKGE